MNHDPHNLQRFLHAQERDYQTALTEITDGQKMSHWMWYIFPQYEGLGFSSTSKHYAIKSSAEAEEYLDHPILGPRLRECVQILLSVNGRSAHQIFGSPDDMKLKSSMTLFAHVSPGEQVFEEALARYFAGQRDRKTLDLVGDGSSYR